jgi:hypothetical protein
MPDEPKKKRKTQQRENSAGARIERFVPIATRLDKPMRQFEQYLIENPNCLFMTAMEMQPEDSKWHKFMILSVDPSVQHRTLAWKARQCGVTLRELMEMMNQARNLEGMLRVGEHVPKIMEDQALAALATELPCADCKGTKTKIVMKKDEAGEEEATEVQCPTCHGNGSLRLLGNDKAIDRTLQMAGILGKDGGVSVSISNTVTTNNGVTPIEKMSSDIGTIIDVRPE